MIERIKKVQGAGFAVMALDSLLIETLQQFREGMDETPRGKSGQFFQRLLTETAFGENKGFDKKKAHLFYQSIRNGILHMAEIKGSSRILTRGGVPLVCEFRSSRTAKRSMPHSGRDNLLVGRL